MNSEVTQLKIAELERKAEIYHRNAEQLLLIDRRVERLEDHYNNHAKILFNNGQGLLFKLDRLEQARKNNRGALALALSVGSFLVALAGLVIIIVRG